MIVVVGVPGWRTGVLPGPDGLAARVALAAADAGSAVELVGRVGDDPTGDALLLALSKGGVGHAAVLRDPSRGTPLIEAPDEASDAIAPADGHDDDPAGAALSHVDPRLPVLDAADLDLGLRYLSDYRVLIAAQALGPAALGTIDEAAAYSGAHLVVLTTDPAAAEGLTTRSATVLAVPDDDEGAFARLVGAYAVRLDRGAAPGDAFREAVAQVGWSSAED